MNLPLMVSHIRLCQNCRNVFQSTRKMRDWKRGMCQKLLIDGFPPRIPRWLGARDIRQAISNPVALLAQHERTYGPNFIYSFGGARTVLVSTDPAVARHVLKTNHNAYHKSDIQTGIMKEFLGPGLLTDRWDTWRPKRQRLAQAFHPRGLDALSPIMEQTLDGALDRLAPRAAQGPISFKDEVTMQTFAMAARSFLGVSFPLDDVTTLSALIQKIQAFMTKLVVMPFLRPWWRLTGEYAHNQHLRQRGDALLMKQIKERINSPEDHPPDLLGILLDMAVADGDSPATLTIEQVLAEAMQILVAGHETTSNAFVWLMLLLDANETARGIVEREFTEVLGARAPVFSDLANLPRTNAIVEEALRLFPPFWMIDRLALEDDQVAGMSIPRGTTIALFLWGMQRDKGLWQSPELFDPNRFDASLHQHRDFMHLPFGGGPRGCIGVNYARLQIIVLLRRYTRQYRVVFEKGATLDIDPKFILSPQGDVPAKLYRKT